MASHCLQSLVPAQCAQTRLSPPRHITLSQLLGLLELWQQHHLHRGNHPFPSCQKCAGHPSQAKAIRAHFPNVDQTFLPDCIAFGECGACEDEGGLCSTEVSGARRVMSKRGRRKGPSSASPCRACHFRGMHSCSVPPHAAAIHRWTCVLQFQRDLWGNSHFFCLLHLIITLGPLS